MTREQIEAKVIELIHKEPFFPFRVEMASGDVLTVPHPRLAVNTTGAGFIGTDGGIVDIDFANVHAIRTVAPDVEC
jgi:hypothetical protein